MIHQKNMSSKNISSSIKTDTAAEPTIQVLYFIEVLIDIHEKAENTL